MSAPDSVAPPALLRGEETSEQDVRDAVGMRTVVELPNLLFDYSREPMISFLVRTPAEARQRYGSTVAFGRLELELPHDGALVRTSVLIDNVSMDYLRQCQHGPEIAQRNDAERSSNVRAFNIYESPCSFADFVRARLQRVRPPASTTSAAPSRSRVRARRTAK